MSKIITTDFKGINEAFRMLKENLPKLSFKDFLESVQIPTVELPEEVEEAMESSSSSSTN